MGDSSLGVDLVTVIIRQFRPCAIYSLCKCIRLGRGKKMFNKTNLLFRGIAILLALTVWSATFAPPVRAAGFLLKQIAMTAST